MQPETVRELRRTQIVAAARTLVAELGLEALTIGALEARLHFSRGVITYHFENKEEIVAELFKSAIDEIEIAVRADVKARLTLAEKLAAVVHGNVRGFLGHPEALRILVSMWSRAHSDDRARAASAGLYAKYRARVVALLGAEHAGAAVHATDIDSMGALVVGIVIGIVVQEYLEPGATDVEATSQQAVDALSALLTR